MSIVPNKQLQKLQWAEAHVEPFTTNAVAIGTTVLEAAAFETRTEAARAAMTAADAAREATKNATTTLKNAIAALNIAAAGIIKQVRAKAETTGNPGVYALASLPMPVTPSPVGAPGLPTGLVATLKPNGSLELTWTSVNPPGCHNVIYQIYRRIESTGEYTYLGGVGDRKFVDLTLPSAVASVMYQIQGTRSTAVGDVAEFIVNFGTTGSGGTMVASVASGKAAKIAA